MKLLLRSLLLAVLISDTSGTGEPQTAFGHAAELGDDFESQMMIIYSKYCGQACTSRFQFRQAYNVYCQQCFCDDQCAAYDDCCPDKKPLKLSYRSECQATTLTDFPSDTLISMSRMITSCSSDNDDLEVLQLCQNTSTALISLVQPVTDSNTQLTYRNRYCAECNNIDLSVIPWSLHIHCRSAIPSRIGNTPQEAYDSFRSTKKCNVGFIPESSAAAHDCLKVATTLVSTCNESGLWVNFDERVQRGCAQFRGGFVKNYKNLFCYLCNTDHDWDELLQRRVRIAPDNEDMDDVTGIIDYTLGDVDYGVMDDEPEETSCPLHQIWDVYQCKCRDVSCADGKILRNRTCLAILPLYDGYLIDVCLELHVSTSERPPSRRTYPMIYLENFTTRFSKIRELRPKFFKASTQYLSTCGDIIKTTMHVLARYQARQPIDNDAIVKVVLTLADGLPKPKTTENISSSFITDCWQPVLNQQGDVTFCDDINPAGFKRNYRSLKTVSPLAASWLYLCVNIRLNKSEVNLSDNGNSLTILVNGKILTADRFRVVYDGYLVCVDEYLATSRAIEFCQDTRLPVSTSHRHAPEVASLLVSITLGTLMLKSKHVI